MADVLELTSKVTVAQVLERGDFQKRFTRNQPISLMEFMYPLLQGMDSLAIEADIELGGSDQLWNNMMGRVLQERYGKRGQMVLTMPLLVGTDGDKKMSQSLGNYIAVDDEPAEMFGKIMSIPDHLMAQYFELATDLPEVEVRGSSPDWAMVHFTPERPSVAWAGRSSVFTGRREPPRKPKRLSIRSSNAARFPMTSWSSLCQTMIPFIYRPSCEMPVW